MSKSDRDYSSEANEAVGDKATGSKRPNILFFFTDDQRFDTINALGNRQIITPTLDALVREGTVFTNAYIMGGTSGAVCMPSRAMLMTGRTLFRLQEQGQNIPPEHVMLPELLRQAGYSTFGTGKWHNGTESYARGFSDGAEIFFGGMEDHWNVPACDFDPTGKYPAPRERSMKKEIQGAKDIRLQEIYDHIAAGTHSSELFCDAAIDFLHRYETANPFFMYVSFMAPHDPRIMPAGYLRMYDANNIDTPENFLPEHPFDNGALRIRDELLAAWPRRPEEIRRHIADYYAMITHVDAQIGRVLAALKQSGQTDNTIVVFAGDNGLALGRHGLMGKQSMYEHSVHVPLIMSGPGVPKNKKRAAFCYLLDIFPTLCELIGLAIPDSVDGQSLAPLMQDDNRQSRETLLFAYIDCQRSVRDERFKLIEYAVEGKRTTQLFDLQEDPLETNNLAGKAGYAEQLSRLRKELRRWPSELGDTQEFGKTFWNSYDAG